jgi:hypothetical protein
MSKECSAPSSARKAAQYVGQGISVKAHPLPRMHAAMASMLWFMTSRPASLSSVMQVITYMGGAISLMRTGQSEVPIVSDRRISQ